MKILNELFDHVYVLTIPSHQEKLTRLQSQLEGVEYELVEGVTASNYKIDELRQMVISEVPLVTEPINPQIPARNLAIWLGMKKVRDLILTRNQRALVLEDDCWFLPDATRRLRHYADELQSEPINNNWHLLYLYRENAASAIDQAMFREHLGCAPGYPVAYKVVLPVLYNRDYMHNYMSGEPLIHWLQYGQFPTSEFCSNNRELIQREDGSILDHIYRGCSERVSTCAYAISATAIEEMLKEQIIWTNDWWVARLTEPGNPFRQHCYCCTPCPCRPRGL